MEYTELRTRLEALRSEKILTVPHLEEVKDKALALAEEAISSLESFVALYEESLAPAPSFAFEGDEGIK